MSHSELPCPSCSIVPYYCVGHVLLFCDVLYPQFHCNALSFCAHLSVFVWATRSRCERGICMFGILLWWRRLTALRKDVVVMENRNVRFRFCGAKGPMCRIPEEAEPSHR